MISDYMENTCLCIFEIVTVTYTLGHAGPELNPERDGRILLNANIKSIISLFMITYDIENTYYMYNECVFEIVTVTYVLRYAGPELDPERDGQRPQLRGQPPRRHRPPRGVASVISKYITHTCMHS